MATPDSMQDFIRYHRRMFGLMIGACLAVFAVLLAVMRQDTAWAGGFAVGAAAQLVKFGFLDIAVIKKIAAEKKDPAVTQLKAMLVSLALFGAAVVFVYTFALNVWTMAAGIFLPRLILLANAYIRPNPFGTGTEDAAAEETGE